MKDYNIEYIIYSGEDVPDLNIIEKAKNRFGIEITGHVKFVKLKGTDAVKGERYLFATMIRQIIGMVSLTFEALATYPCDVFVDTTGLAFSYWVVKGCVSTAKVVAYVHYPFIRLTLPHTLTSQSSDMIDRVKNSKRSLITKPKYIYYKWLINLYKYMGSHCDFAMANSTWTHDHMEKIW